MRDWLVVGICDLALLETEASLTLEKAKTMIRQKEATKEHTCEMQGNGEAILNRLGQRGIGGTQGSYQPRS